MKLSAVIAPLLTFAVLVLSCSPAVAVPEPGCLPTPLPSGPGSNPSFSMNVLYGQDQLRVTLWRQQCQNTGDIVLLMRATPVSVSSLLCASRWYLDQDLSRFEVTFRTIIAPLVDGPGPPFCETIAAPVTIIVAPSTLAGGAPGTFDATDDFSLLYYGATEDGGRYVVYRLEIPYPSPILPPPVLPTIAVVATGCTTCRSGEVVAYQTNVNNPGPPLRVEYRGGVRMPDGSILPLVNQVTTIPSGASILALLPAQALPTVPAVDLLVEAALLEPSLGVTLSRHNVTLHLSP